MRTYAEKNWGNCNKAIAYSLNFTQMCYSAGNTSRNDYYRIVCDICQREKQIKDFEYRKSDFSKKDYFILDYYCFGVSEKFKNDMIEFGLNDKNFRPIFTRKHDQILGYQIITDNILPPTFKANGKYEFSSCDACGHKVYEVCDDVDVTKVYGGLGYPVFLTQEAAEKLGHISCLYEDNDDILISLELYDFLIKKYPRLECRPVFIGSVYEDNEYLRLKNE